MARNEKGRQPELAALEIEDRNASITDIQSGAGTVNEMAPDPFDLSGLVLAQNFHETVGVKKLLTSVPCRKPPKQDFVRVHPGADYRLSPAALIELKEDREVYLLRPQLAAKLPGEFTAHTLYTCINRQGVLSIWHIRLPGEDGKLLEWHRSAAEAAERAMSRWIRMQANMSLGAYEISEARGNLPEPEWPEYSFREILEVAFKDRLIGDEDHPVVKRLRGLE